MYLYVEVIVEFSYKTYNAMKQYFAVLANLHSHTSQNGFIHFRF